VRQPDHHSPKPVEPAFDALRRDRFGRADAAAPRSRFDRLCESDRTPDPIGGRDSCGRLGGSVRPCSAEQSATGIDAGDGGRREEPRPIEVMRVDVAPPTQMLTLPGESQGWYNSTAEVADLAKLLISLKIEWLVAQP